MQQWSGTLIPAAVKHILNRLKRKNWQQFSQGTYCCIVQSNTRFGEQGTGNCFKASL